MLLAAAPADRTARTLDLAGPFATRSSWRLTVTQAADIPDPIMDDGGRVPGPLTFCMTRDGDRSCDPHVGDSLRGSGADDVFDTAHDLQRLAIMRPRAAQPLLLLQIGSLRSVNGNQRVGTELYRYDRAADRFTRVYRHQNGRNNNEEVRYIAAGPLDGAVIAAEPTGDAPFGYWMTVERRGAGGAYRPVLRYRSATRYGDGNPLAVIDSEMPAIQRRLGLWRPGRPLPVPAHCATPRLIRRALWCDAPPAP